MNTGAREPRDRSQARAATVLPLPAGQVWDLVTDVRNHARWVPLTRIDAPGAALAQGTEFTAVTGPGAGRGLPGLVDRMVVTGVHPPAGRNPGRATYRKVGPVLSGTAELHVRPLGPTHTEVAWVERIGLRGVPAVLTATPSRLASAAMLRVVLHRLRREVRGAGRARGARGARDSRDAA